MVTIKTACKVHKTPNSSRLLIHSLFLFLLMGVAIDRQNVIKTIRNIPTTLQF